MSTAHGKLSVLVADDEPSIRDLVQQWLERAGHSVVSAGTGDKGVRALRAHRFDLMITDIVMPDGDGYELIASCKKVQPATRIVAMSGGGKYLQSADCLKVARGLGAHAVVMKPFSAEQLQTAIETALSMPKP